MTLFVASLDWAAFEADWGTYAKVCEREREWKVATEGGTDRVR